MSKNEMLHKVSVKD